MDIEVQVTLNRFPELAGDLDATAEQALDMGVQVAIATADPLTRRDTGALINNKTVEGSAGSRTITWNQPYAAFQNDGTIYMSGTHFANRGADAARLAIETELERYGR